MLSLGLQPSLRPLGVWWADTKRLRLLTTPNSEQRAGWTEVLFETDSTTSCG